MITVSAGIIRRQLGVLDASLQSQVKQMLRSLFAV